MSLTEANCIQRVGIVGAGTMGAGIAQVFLRAGCSVHLHDSSPSQMEAATERVRSGLQRWESKGELPDAAEAMKRLTSRGGLVEVSHCEWVLEAVAEDVGVKEEVLRTLGRLCRPETVLASNTSSISLTRLGAASGRPELTVGMHFFNPPHAMRLVEVVSGFRTAPELVQATCALAERLGKVPVQSQDRAGFLSNRILMPMLNEAFYALYEGVGTAEAIDQVMKLGMAHPMGPLELSDFIGLDVVLAILETLHRELGDPKYRPCPLLRKYVEAGWLGRKSGRGVYPYAPK